MKRTLTFILLSIVLLAAAACGKNNSDGGSSKAANSPAASPSSAAQSPSAEPSAEKTGNFALDYKPNKDKGFLVGFSNGYFGNAWRGQMIDDVKAVGDKYKKDGTLTDLIVQNTNGVPQQIAAIESMINQGVNAIVIDPASSSALTTVVAKAISKGILVVNVDDPAEFDNVINVVPDQLSFWRVQAKWLAETLKGKGNIVVINGLAGNAADDLRTKAAIEVLKQYPDIKILGSAPGGWDQTKAKQVMSNFLSAYKNIDGILMQEVMAEGVMQAYQAAGKDLPVMTGDYNFGFLRKWNEKYPNLQSMTTTNPPGIGANGLEAAIQILKGNKIKPDSLQPNPMKPELKNTIISHAPYVITKNAEPTGSWMKNENPSIKAIGLDEALKLGDGLPDNASIDRYWSDDELATIFTSK